MAHHLTFELALPDGRVLRTRISRPPDGTAYGRNLWHHILRDQLDVTEPEFWACVQDGVRPDRGADDGGVPAGALPASLVHQLIHVAGVPEREIEGLTLDVAVEIMSAVWSRP